MADYRGVVRHVRYWRGTIQKWSTVYPYTGSGATLNTAACNVLQAADSALCYAQTGIKAGGIYQVEWYHASGGVPIVTNNYFDPEVPTAWVAYTSTAWTLNQTRIVDPVAETSLGIRWAAGLSSTGKAVYFRKWLHAVPLAGSGTPGSVDIVASEVTSLTTAAVNIAACMAPTYGLSLGNGRTLAGTATVSAFYENHQMPRGRRRPPLVTAGGRYKGPTVVVPD
jgi:hypothetical protein